MSTQTPRSNPEDDTSTRIPPRRRTKYLSRHILRSDHHGFVGRIYDLSIIGLHFDNYDDLAIYPDCKYAFDVNYDLTALTRRVESLNMAGDLLWMDPIPKTFEGFPISSYQWLTVSADVFLMRYVSVVDCATILAGVVFETGLELRKCSIDNLRKKGVSQAALSLLEAMVDGQGPLRSERNARFHHGAERAFTHDDQTFRLATLWETRGRGMVGRDRFGRRINTGRSFREGLVGLQREFNQSTRTLVRQLDQLYDVLWPAFEDRFGPLIRNSTHGLGVSRSA